MLNLQATLWCLLASLVSEDLACLSAGILVGGHLSLADAIVGCVLGTILGDFAWVFVGKYARRFNLLHRLPSSWPLGNNFKRMEELVRSRAVPLLVASRFVPGMRTIVLVAIGGAGTPLRSLLIPAFLAVLVYTTALIVLGWQVGASIEPFLRYYIHGTWWVVAGILIVSALFIVLKQLVVRPTIERFLKHQLQADESLAISDTDDIAPQAGEAQTHDAPQHDSSQSASK